MLIERPAIWQQKIRLSKNDNQMAGYKPAMDIAEHIGASFMLTRIMITALQL